MDSQAVRRENTLVEWEQSPAARNGMTCQSCHMPQRRHLWRGIHDPDMVRSGLTPEFVAEADAARFRLTSTGRPRIPNLCDA
ncbi:hypothetical protein ES707_01639 [subsurface metagenome]|jgi:hypothetical protein